MASLAALFALHKVPALAAPVSPERAVDGVSAWVARGPASSRLPTGEVRTFSLGGMDYFHLVGLTDGGWVAMPADDAYDPVFAFAKSGELPDADDGNPCWMVFARECGMKGDGSTAVARKFRFDVEATVVTPAAVRTKGLLTAASASSAPVVADLSWGSLDGDTAGAGAWREKRSTRPMLKSNFDSNDGDLIDVRVPSFLECRWDQCEVWGEPCYNYYTPMVRSPEGEVWHAPSGCSATALAQLMWYYKFPAQAPNPTKEYQIGVYDPITDEYTFTKEKMLAGPFDWDEMVADPGALGDPDTPGVLTEANREAIGKLMYACGLAYSMSYAYDGSSNNRPTAEEWFVEKRGIIETELGYGGSDLYANPASFTEYTRTILANFDARQPCLCGVAGHATVGDGYGFSEGALFVHLNMGWGGFSDMFYRQTIGKHQWASVSGIECNVSTNGVVRYVTGRVTDKSGEALPGASVRAEVTRNGATTVQNLVTDEKGIYAVRVEGESREVIGSTVVLSASMDGLAPTVSSRTAYTTSEPDGNSWGNDFVLAGDSDVCLWTGDADDCRFSSSGNWRNGVLPTDVDKPIILFEGFGEIVVTNDLDEVSPGAIMFGRCSGVVTICGNEIVMPEGGFIANYDGGISDAQAPVFDVHVEFPDDVKVDGLVNFRGGVKGVTVLNVERILGAYTLTTSDEWLSNSAPIASGSSLSVGRFCSDGPFLEVESDSELVVGVARGYRWQLLYRIDGTFAVTNELEVTLPDEDEVHVSRYPGDGTFKFEKVTLADSGVAQWFIWACIQDVSTNSFWIGEGGLNFADGTTNDTAYCCGAYDGDVVYLRPWHSDYAIATKTGTASTADLVVWKETHFGTDDESDVPRTVTCNGLMTGDSWVSAFVEGSGTFVVNNPGNTYSGSWTVTNSATLAVGPGASLGTGSVTLCPGTTLDLHSSSGTLTALGNVIYLPSGENETVALKLDGGVFGVGTYPIYSKDGLAAEDVAAAAAHLSPVVQAGTERTFVAEGDTLYLVVVAFSRELSGGEYLSVPDGGMAFDCLTLSGASMENPVFVLVDDGEMLQPGTRLVLTASSFPDQSPSEYLSLANEIPDSCYATFWQYGDSIYVSIMPRNWVDEKTDTASLTGQWTSDVVYDEYGLAKLSGSTVFEPYSASTGNVVTIETTLQLIACANSTPDDSTQAAVRLYTNGCLQVWSQLRDVNDAQVGWVDVEADGLVPVSGEEYTVRFTFNYAANAYSVDIAAEGCEFASVSEKGDSTMKTFLLASSANCVSSVEINGEANFRSLLGVCKLVALGFAEDDVLVLKNNVEVVLSAAKAAWLNKCAGGDKSVVESAAAGLTEQEFSDAYLLNVDVAGDRSYSLKVTSVDVSDETVTVGVELTRSDKVGQAINGVLKLYGTETLSAFKDGADAPISTAVISDETFSNGDTATGEFEIDDAAKAKFLKAKIE